MPDDEREIARQDPVPRRDTSPVQPVQAEEHNTDSLAQDGRVVMVSPSVHDATGQLEEHDAAPMDVAENESPTQVAVQMDVAENHLSVRETGAMSEGRGNDTGQDSSDDIESESEHESESDGGMRTAPTCLKDLFERKEWHIDQFIAANKRFQKPYLQHQVARLEKDLIKELEMTKDEPWMEDQIREKYEDLIREKRWCLKYHRREAWKEVLLEQPWAMFSLRRLPIEGWSGYMWYSRTTIIKVALEDKWVRNLLGPIKYQDKKFQGNEFKELKPYDRMVEIEETKFRSIRKTGRNRFELIDYAGSPYPAVVTRTWARAHYKKSKVDQAVYLFACEKFNKTVDLNSGSMPRGDLDLGLPPLGAANNVGSPESTTGGEGLPPIIFENKKEECMPYSLANAVHWLGRTELALKIAIPRNTDYSLLIRTVKPYVVRRAYVNGVRFDPLCHDHRIMNPVFAQLKAVKDNEYGQQKPIGIQHSVCFVMGLVFDSNMATALPITIENLNIITDSIITGARYSGIELGRELVLQKRNNGRRA